LGAIENLEDSTFSHLVAAGDVELLLPAAEDEILLTARELGRLMLN